MAKAIRGVVVWAGLWSWPRWLLEAGRSRLLLACVLMLGASSLPWLADPLHGCLSPWETPLMPGWFWAAPGTAGAIMTSVGAGSFVVALVCLGCALGPAPSLERGLWRWRLAAGCCLLPLCLFALHFVVVDSEQSDLLAYHKLEAQLILRHLGYNLPRDWLPITAPFALDTTTLDWRLVLLVDQLRPGAVLPLVGLSLWFQPAGRRVGTGCRTAPLALRKLGLTALSSGCLLLMIIVPLCSWFSTEQARQALAVGDYRQALGWIETARWLAPGMANSVTYEEELGEALFAGESPWQAETVNFALARSFLRQRAYLHAYQLLFPDWLAHRLRQNDPFETRLTVALSEALEGLIEAAWPASLLSGDSGARSQRLSVAQHWLMLLAQINPRSLYAHYLLARAYYDLHNYQGCLAEMGSVLTLSSDNDLRSSAYTYLGLSEIALGRTVQGRETLLMAVALDPDYHNNTAREALSGLH
ncbi:tol-pal system YbgF family protein [Thermogemmatispora sp.]|uniref:tetratricopeptide repeat protein n=1 Tax=Thermogemmatispora sp. TaxID=1968838 RepID=UPI0035E41651